MMVRVKLFAAARQLAGSDMIDLKIDEPTVAALRVALAASYPQLTGLLRQTLFAVNAEYAGNDTVIPEGAEVACIPPVSGG